MVNCPSAVMTVAVDFVPVKAVGSHGCPEAKELSGQLSMYFGRLSIPATGRSGYGHHHSSRALLFVLNCLLGD